MNRILGFLVILGSFAGAIALVFAFWPFFVGMAIFSALVLAFFEWRKGAPAREEARLERDWSHDPAIAAEAAYLDEARIQRQRKLQELMAKHDGERGPPLS